MRNPSGSMRSRPIATTHSTKWPPPSMIHVQQQCAFGLCSLLCFLLLGIASQCLLAHFSMWRKTHRCQAHQVLLEPKGPPCCLVMVCARSMTGPQESKGPLVRYTPPNPEDHTSDSILSSRGVPVLTQEHIASVQSH